MSFFSRVCVELATLSLLPFFDERLLRTEPDKVEDIFCFFVCNSSAECGRVSIISNFVKTECKADILHIEQPAQTARLSDRASVDFFRAMIREGRWINKNSAFSVAERNHPAERDTEPFPLVSDKLAATLHLIDGFNCGVMSQTANNSDVDVVGFVKNASARL